MSMVKKLEPMEYSKDRVRGVLEDIGAGILNPQEYNELVHYTFKYLLFKEQTLFAKIMKSLE